MASRPVGVLLALALATMLAGCGGDSERANRLADLFDPSSGPPRPGLATPKAIYAAGANNDGEGLRPRETVMPLVARHGFTMNTEYGAGEETKLVEQVITQPGPTLISWQHGGGGEGGIQHFMETLMPRMVAGWASLGVPDVTPEVKERIVAGVLKEAKGQPIDTLAAERDAMLFGLLAVRAKERG